MPETEFGTGSMKYLPKFNSDGALVVGRATCSIKMTEILILVGPHFG